MTPLINKTEEFAAQAARRRRSELSGWLSLIFFTACGAAYFIAPLDAQFWILVLVIVSFCGMLLTVFLTGALVCPACNGDPDAFGPYCPECGYDTLGAPTGAGFPTCTSCGKTLVNDSEARNYRIRACTHCGCLLDVDGV